MINRFFLYGLISLLFISCNKNNTNSADTALSFKAVMPSELKSSTAGDEFTHKYDTLIIFSGKDIAWYNDKSGELKFNADFSGIPMKYYASVNLLVFSNDVLLFPIKLNISGDAMSNFIIPPCIYIENNGYFIIKSDPNWEGSELNWKEIEPGWNIFIEQLKKEGRYRN